MYLYYALDNRPKWYRLLWRISDSGRALISGLPQRPRALACDVVAGSIYWPLARVAGIADRAGLEASGLPLAAYRDKPFYVMRTDALDRLGTRVEHRFTRDEVVALMRAAWLERISVASGPPYRCVLGYRAATRTEDRD